MGLEIERIGADLLKVGGELDFASFPLLREALLATTGPVTLEVSGLSFMDSTGLRVILERLESGTVTLASPSDHVMRLIELCGLSDLEGLAVQPRTHPD